jgi:hypothetical protein
MSPSDVDKPVENVASFEVSQLLGSEMIIKHADGSIGRVPTASVLGGKFIGQSGYIIYFNA